MKNAFDLLAHAGGDTVAVAVRDIDAARKVKVSYLDGSPTRSASVSEPIQLGHKVALDEIKAGAQIIEYGEVIGRAVEEIGRGAHVHTHNLKGERWS